MSAFKSYSYGELAHEIEQRAIRIEERLEHEPLYNNSSQLHDDLTLLHLARMEFRKRQEQRYPDLLHQSLTFDDLG